MGNGWVYFGTYADIVLPMPGIWETVQLEANSISPKASIMVELDGDAEFFIYGFRLYKKNIIGTTLVQEGAMFKNPMNCKFYTRHTFGYVDPGSYIVRVYRSSMDSYDIDWGTVVGTSGTIKVESGQKIVAPYIDVTEEF